MFIDPSLSLSLSAPSLLPTCMTREIELTATLMPSKLCTVVDIHARNMHIIRDAHAYTFKKKITDARVFVGHVFLVINATARK